MESKNIVEFLKKFKWATLHNMYGCAHNSIIGFISSGWITHGKYHTILDGAPCVNRGRGRKGQQYADILLCKNNKPFIVVEVETGVSKYKEKIKSIISYLNNTKDFGKLKFGILIMTNAYGAYKNKKYKHNWDSIKHMVRLRKKDIVLVSIEKRKILINNSIMGCLRQRNDYYPWEIDNIDYWVYDGQNQKKGNLWKLDK